MVKRLSHLPDSEMEVMQALWQGGPYPIRTTALADRLNRDWKAPTLHKFLSRLEERGFVRSEKEGNIKAYTPLVDREEYLREESLSFLNRLHGGSFSSLVASLFPDMELTKDDEDALRAILEGREH